MLIDHIHHVQLAMPAGREAEARAFYAGLLGIPEVSKPPKLAANGGAWFERGNLRVHLGIQADFHPAKKAHVAFQVSDLEELASRMRAENVEVTTDDSLPGIDRFFAEDPFGNKLEFLQPRE